MSDILYAIRSTYVTPCGNKSVSFMNADGAWEPPHLAKNRLAARTLGAAKAMVEYYKASGFFNPECEKVELIAVRPK